MIRALVFHSIVCCVAILSSFGVSAQKDTVGVIKKDSGGGTILDSISSLFYTGPSVYQIRGLSDTTKVIMLCSDTTAIKGNIFWMYGYSVSRPNAYTQYLNRFKKPISKKVFVWMSVGAEKRK